jgi:BNR repeat-like domain
MKRIIWRAHDHAGRGLVAAAVALWFALATGSPIAYAGANLLRLSTDPYTNAASQHRTEVEPDTFSFGSTVVSAFQVGRIFGGGAANIGFATSTNGGSSWVSGFLPGSTVNATPAGRYRAVSDPSVAFDARHGVWLISFLGITSGSEVDVVASRSTDGGLTWSNPVTIDADGDFNDKNWTVCDTNPSSPFYGNCYTEFDEATFNDLEQMSRSTDGGLTWGPSLPNGNKDHGIGGQPLVQPNGTVIVPFNSFRGRNFNVSAFISTNGGVSWSSSSTIAPVFFHHAAGGIRDSIPLPSAEVDAAGRVYVTWQDCRLEPKCSASDLLLSTSTDGVNWTDPTQIPVDPIGSGVDHFFPGLAVDRTTSGTSARLLVLYYFYPDANCTTATCQLDVGYTSSINGGETWAAGAQVAGPMSLTWLPNTSQGFMVGDYFSTSFLSGGIAYPAFANASALSGGLLDEAIFTVQGGLAATGGSIPAGRKSSVQATGQATGSSITAQ